VLGKAMRFGAMFAAGDPARAGRLSWRRKRKILGLELTPEGEILFGEVARARFLSLAQALKAEPVIIPAGEAEREGGAREGVGKEGAGKEGGAQEGVAC